MQDWHLNVKVVPLALRAAVRDHHGHGSRVGVLVAAPLHTRLLPKPVACRNDPFHLNFDHWRRGASAGILAHRHMGIQSFAAQIVQINLGYLSQQAQSVCLTANWPPLC